MFKSHNENTSLIYKIVLVTTETQEQWYHIGMFITDFD